MPDDCRSKMRNIGSRAQLKSSHGVAAVHVTLYLKQSIRRRVVPTLSSSSEESAHFANDYLAALRRHIDGIPNAQQSISTRRRARNAWLSDVCVPDASYFAPQNQANKTPETRVLCH